MNIYDEQLTLKQKIRRNILQYGEKLSDKQMISLQYALKYKRSINWNKPERFTEKLQWCKINYRNPLMRICADKFEVRNYVKDKGLASILNELYGVYDIAEDIEFDKLPNQFVMKVNNGSGTNIIVADKSKLEEDSAKEALNGWLKRRVISYSREWQYENMSPKIIIEKYLQLDENNDLSDYKFFCFNGKVFCLYVTKNYVHNHKDAQIGFFGTDFKRLPYFRKDYTPLKENLKKPKNFEYMVKIAEKLSQGFPHVRVDLYNIDGQIIFGELTFCTSNGYVQFEPDEFDFILGQQFVLPEERNI